jgi:hypothetical protein
MARRNESSENNERQVPLEAIIYILVNKNEA